MEATPLGRTGLVVSVAALGTGGKSRLGLSQGKSYAEAVALVRTALDGGVTLIDTAAAYGTEEIIGEAVKGRRDEVVISTKMPVTGEFSSEILIDGAELERRVDAALSRLGTDRIDIMHMHGVTEEQYAHARDELMPVLQRLKRAGKIRFTGVTERFVEDPEHKVLSRAIADRLADVVMIGFNFINQTAARKLLPAANAAGIGTLCMFAVRGPLARLESANALVQKLVEAGEVDAASVDAANPLGFLLDPGVASSLNEAAYRFCRHTPGMDVVITGTGNQDHLVQNLKSISGPPLPAVVLGGARDRRACVKSRWPGRTVAAKTNTLPSCDAQVAESARRKDSARRRAGGAT